MHNRVQTVEIPQATIAPSRAPAIRCLSAERSCEVHLGVIRADLHDMHDSHLPMPLMAVQFSITATLNGINYVMDDVWSYYSGYGSHTRQYRVSKLMNRPSLLILLPIQLSVSWSTDG